MTARVTHRSIQETTLAHLQGNLQSISKLQEQVSSGKRINRPSDDAPGTVTALAVRQQLRLNDQYERAAQDGQSWLAVQDTALQTASSQLRVVEARVLSSLNASNGSDGARTANAVEIDGIAKTMQSLMNSTYLGRNVFAGTSGAGDAVIETTVAGVTTRSWSLTGPSPASPPTSGMQTSSGEVLRQVDGSTGVRVDTDGRKVFGDDSNPAVYGENVVTLLGRISAEIKTPTVGDTGRTALRSMYADLQERLGSVLENLSDVGARGNRITNSQASAAADKLTLTQQLSDVEDADVPSVMINLSLQSTAYQYALKANAKVLSTSLMDFLS